MRRIVGVGIGGGVAIGDLRLWAPPEPDGGEAPLRRSEPPDIILHCTDVRIPKDAREPGVVGVVIEGAAEPPMAPGLPMVRVSIGFGALVGRGGLTIVDAPRSLVITDPDAETLAAYQSEAERLHARTRHHLGVEHDFARTTDGATVRVLACASDLGDIEAAVEVGADAVVVIDGIDAAPAAIARATHGKPLIMLAPEDEAGMEAALTLAASHDLTLLCASAAFEGVREAMLLTRDRLLARDRRFGSVRLGLLARPGGAGEAPEHVERCVVDARGSGAEEMSGLSAFVDLGRTLAVPVEVVLSGSPRVLRAAITAGVSGVVTSIDHVREAKAAIRAYPGEPDAE